MPVNIFCKQRSWYIIFIATERMFNFFGNKPKTGNYMKDKNH